jgi:hypothetical protein
MEIRETGHTLLRLYPARRKLDAIAAARAAFARCQFDEGACDLGLRRLRAYRKEWDESRGVWKHRPWRGSDPCLRNLQLEMLADLGVLR